MRFVECVDYGDVPCTFVSGVASVSLIGSNQVQVAFYQTRELPDGEIEHRIIEYQVWDLTLWIENATAFRQAHEAIENGTMRPPSRAASGAEAVRRH